MRFYVVLSCAVVAVHALFILWIIFGAALTRGRPLLRNLHIASIFWGVLIEVAPWPCPLTYLENWLEVRAGRTGYHNGFMLHYLDKLVYPDVPPDLLTVASILVCAINLTIYILRWRRESGIVRHSAGRE
jgi:hypothetical protein